MELYCQCYRFLVKIFLEKEKNGHYITILDM